MLLSLFPQIFPHLFSYKCRGLSLGVPQAWCWGAVSTPHLLAQLSLFQHQWEKGWGTPLHPSPVWMASWGLSAGLAPHLSVPWWQTGSLIPTAACSLLKAARRDPRRQWGINYTAAMVSATRALGRLVQAGPPQLCCHHPGHSSESSPSHPDPDFDAGGTTAIHLGITAPHNFSIPCFRMLDFRRHRFHFPRCQALLSPAAMTAQQKHQTKASGLNREGG